jgi:hypothetical protein
MRSRTQKTSQRRVGPTPVRTWLSIRVELIEGRGERYWPRPGRLFAAATALRLYLQLLVRSFRIVAEQVLAPATSVGDLSAQVERG